MRKAIIIVLLFVTFTSVFGQVELVPVEHKVYDYLFRMKTKGIVEDYNPAQLPISRNMVSLFLKEIETRKDISKNDRNLLNDFLVEFEYDLDKSLKKSSSLFGEEKKKYSFTDNKYFYSYTDSNVSFFSNIKSSIYQKNGWGDSIRGRIFTAADLGLEFRGSLFNKVGYYFSFSNGSVFNGKKIDKIFAMSYDPLFGRNKGLVNDGRYFDNFEGYIRYEVPKKWFSLTVGKESYSQGNGYIDKLFLSNNSNSIPSIKLDLRYKAVQYSFFYGNLQGDSAGTGMSIENKMISTHRLDVMFVKWLRAGFFESLITSNAAFSFVHLNPLSFLTSADLNTGAQESYKSNSFMGFDVELNPFRNLSIQGSLLIDDLNLATLTVNAREANDNKFGYQVGMFWNDAFFLDGFSGAVEYTRLDPFVYTHRYNTQQYTNWGFPLGHFLPPNSDEWAFKFNYNLMPRLNIGILLQFQRSGEGFTYDSLGLIDINYGGNINHGERYYDTIKNIFLQGYRVNRSIVGVSMRWEPVRQWGVEVKYFYKYQNLIYASKKVKDSFYYLNLFLKI